MIHDQDVEPAESGYSRGDEGTAIGWRAQLLTDCDAMFGTAGVGYNAFGLYTGLTETEGDARARLAEQPDDLGADAAGASGDESHFAVEG